MLTGISDRSKTGQTASQQTQGKKTSFVEKTGARIYLDANATTAASAAVIAAIVETMRPGVGNPASSHLDGGAARQLLEVARDRVCLLLPGSYPEDVIFVSGGTEANNTVLRSLISDEEATFVVSATEHPSILQPVEKLAPKRIRWLRADSCGRIDPEEVRRQALAIGGKIVLAIQAANSETGVIQPVEDIVKILRRSHDKAFIHIDAAQAIGRVRLPLVDVDLISFSGHKIHGPAGTGVLYLRDIGPAPIAPLILGGAQERGMRSGTPNLPGIVGMGVAILERTRCFSAAVSEMALMRDTFENTLLSKLGASVVVNGAGAERVVNTSNLRFEGLEGMQILARLNDRGVMASQGSACSSGRPEPSRVLLSMGLTEREAFSSLRFSFSISNTQDEAAKAAEIVASVMRELQ